MTIGFHNKYVKYLCLYLLSIILLLSSCKTSKNNDFPYLKDHELTYRGLTIGETTVEELLETLGEPFEIYQEKTLERSLLSYYYPYDKYFADGVLFGFDYMFHETPTTLQRIYLKEYSDYPTPYNINISDLLETVLKKLSLEPNIEKNVLDHVKSGEDYTGLLYGTSSGEIGFGSFSIYEKGRKEDIRLVTSTGLELLILIKNHLVGQIEIGYYNVGD